MKKVKYIIFASCVLMLVSCGEKAEESKSNNVAVSVTNGIASASFKVWGNCEMCKETIESSLKVEGVSKADWNVDSKIISVSYDSSKITLDQIQKNIAAVGYDNEKYKGDDKAYEDLPGCCQYDRK